MNLKRKSQNVAEKATSTLIRATSARTATTSTSSTSRRKRINIARPIGIAIRKALLFLLLFALFILITSYYVIVKAEHQPSNYLDEQYQQQQQYPQQNHQYQYKKNIHIDQQGQSQNQNQKIVLAGIIEDANNINDDVISYLSTLNCQFQIHIHILVRYNNQLDKTRIRHDNNCAQVIVEYEEDEDGVNNNDHGNGNAYDDNIIIKRRTNRIDNLSIVRDNHRLKIKQQFFQNTSSSSSDINNGIVILADLDLFKFPNQQLLMEQIHELQKEEYTHNAICTNGVVNHWSPKYKKYFLWYYDTFAAVFKPGVVSLLKMENRLIQHNNISNGDGSNESNGKGKNVQRRLSQHHIYQYILLRGDESSTGNFSVQSCFGGMTIYKAKTYFHDSCQYQLDPTIISTKKDDLTSIMRYANKRDERPCEHVVFHDCLYSNVKDFDIAINPKLLSFRK